ncbi:MAG: hypothetical protein AAF250_07920 [Pseudomonadota bacterium]
MASKPPNQSIFGSMNFLPRVNGVDPETGRLLPLSNRSIPQLRGDNRSEKERLRASVRLHESEYVRASNFRDDQRMAEILMRVVNLIHDFLGDYLDAVKGRAELHNRINEMLRGAPRLAGAARQITLAEWSQLSGARRLRVGYENLLRRITRRVVRTQPRRAARRASK